MIASLNDHLDMVKSLLENKAQVDLQDNEGWTPLMLAIKNNHFKVVDMLLKIKQTGTCKIIKAYRQLILLNI